MLSRTVLNLTQRCPNPPWAWISAIQITLSLTQCCLDHPQLYSAQTGSPLSLTQHRLDHPQLDSALSRPPAAWLSAVQTTPQLDSALSRSPSAWFSAVRITLSLTQCCPDHPQLDSALSGLPSASWLSAVWTIQGLTMDNEQLDSSLSHTAFSLSQCQCFVLLHPLQCIVDEEQRNFVRPLLFILSSNLLI